VRTLRAIGFVGFVVLAGLATGCVRKTDYDKVVADATKAKADADAAQKADADDIVKLKDAVAAADAETQDRDAKISDLSTASHNVQAELDEATAMNDQLRGELQRLGKNVDKILQERGTLAKALDDAKLRLDELRKAQAAAEARTQLFRDLEHKLKPLVDAGQLRVESRRGRLVIDVSGDLLFEPARAEVRTAGQGVLMEIAKALPVGGAAPTPPAPGSSPPPPSPSSPSSSASASAPQPAPPPASAPPSRRFLVIAHVDDAPLKSKRYKTAWELTAARGVAVVEYLVSMGVPAEALTAAGAGGYDPLVPNDSADARAKNRRVEIALMPAADETVLAPAPSR
jgi:chemotaxis protein MotB